MRENEIIRATVTAVHEYGVDVEAEGCVGFVQPNELSWTATHVKPADLVKVGALVDVLVYAITPARFFASIKRADPESDPWKDSSRFSAASRHTGVIRQVVDWGCKVEIAPGVYGMILLERHPGSYTLGSTIEVEIVDVDPKLKRIELKPLRSP